MTMRRLHLYPALSALVVTLMLFSGCELRGEVGDNLCERDGPPCDREEQDGGTPDDAGSTPDGGTPSFDPRSVCDDVDGVVLDGDIVVNTIASVTAAASVECVRGDVIIAGIDQPVPADVELPALAHIEGSLVFEYADELVSLSLPALVSIGENLDLGQSSLADLTGLSALSVVQGDVKIGHDCCSDDNYELVSVDGLEGLQEVGGQLMVAHNPSLTDLSGLGNVTRTGTKGFTGDVTIEGNASLVDLAGLASLATVGGSLFIEENNALTSLHGLEALRVIDEDLHIGDTCCGNNGNADLVDLDALYGLTSVGGEAFDAGEIVIAENWSLPECAASALVSDLIARGAFSGETTISGNGTGTCP